MALHSVGLRDFEEVLEFAQRVSLNITEHLPGGGTMQETDTWSEKICDDEQLMIDDVVIEKMSDITARRNRVETLIVSSENQKTTVNPQIYKRVSRDYMARLTAINKELNPVSKKVESQLHDIKRFETIIGKCLNSIEDDLQEQKFRCDIGEFDQPEHTQQIKHLSELRDVLNRQAKLAQSTLATCSQHLGAWPADENMEDKKLRRSDLVPKDPSLDCTNRDQPMPVLAPNDSKNPESKLAGSTGDEHLVPTSGAFLKLSGFNAVPKAYEIGKRNLTIGKSSSNDIIIRRAGISRKHAQVTFKDDGNYTIEDLSGNGFKLNGTPTNHATIVHGDVVSLANVDLELVVN
jgi:hypothetical protein